MTTFNRSDLVDNIPTALLFELVKTGNMAARRALIERRKGAEEALSLNHFQRMVGAKGVEKMWQQMQEITAFLGSHAVVGKDRISNLADDDELEQCGTTGNRVVMLLD